MQRKLKFRPSLADTKRANKSAHEYYAALSGRETPPEQAALLAKVKPKQTREKKRPLTPSESDIQRAIIGYLCHHPKVAIVIRFNSGAVTDGKYYVEFARIHTRGLQGEKLRLPDVYALLKNGRTLWVEVKRGGWTAPKDQREIEQRNFLHTVAACNGIGIFASSVDDVAACLGLPKGE